MVCAPLQVVAPFVKFGVTVIVAVTGAEPLFVAVKDDMLPVPFAARPIDVLSLLHENVVPGTAPEKAIAVVDELLQTVWLITEFTVGVGLTAIVNEVGDPEHVTPLFVTGVTEIVAV